jgi:hypothetical protein
MKTEVYSWRVSTELKSGLERAARSRKISVSKALDLAVEEWLKNGAKDVDDALEQKQLHVATEKFAGAISGDDLPASTRVRQALRESLRRRHGG